jgi:hypothetical protein
VFDIFCVLLTDTLLVLAGFDRFARAKTHLRGARPQLLAGVTPGHDGK